MDAEKDKYFSQLFIQAQDGDQEAYAKFLTEISQVLRAYLLRRINEKDLMDDVLQETLIAVHRARHTFLPERPVGPWLYAICNHRLTDFYRKLRRVQSFERSVPHDEFPEIIAHDEESSSGAALLAELSDSQRSVIHLLKIDGFSVREVALKLGMTESNVKITAFRGYETIRRSMGIKRL